MSLFKTDLQLAERYVAALAPQKTLLLDAIQAGFDPTVSRVLQVTGDRALLDRDQSYEPASRCVTLTLSRFTSCRFSFSQAASR
ncbi:phosphoenolpyruvate carboxylase [Microbacterium sp.]|uniref:phosphoenolpyruvate carboxylase n=1 Tax=Microbacterium sp. TaxID=51671 RepID=UPI0027352504|nr:phosphoenolpyruvate carboxylase [Microbacterium sp.]MDP3950179.1 phosphoenolpyruvate carboxylase [Microbacterium sp.]